MTRIVRYRYNLIKYRTGCDDIAMKEIADCAAFQNKVKELLIRHRSVLDVLSKFQESNARVNRALAKSVTWCGCLQISAGRQPVPPDADLAEMRNHTQTHLQGELCESCRHILEQELGNNLFYFVSICNLLNLDMSDVLKKEYEKVLTLDRFNLS